MKTKESLIRSKDFRLDKAKFCCEMIIEIHGKEILKGKDLYELKKYAEKIIMCIHEHHAYFDALETE